jgi:hypothetical protein
VGRFNDKCYRIQDETFSDVDLAVQSMRKALLKKASTTFVNKLERVQRDKFRAKQSQASDEQKQDKME